ncbi:MAG: hypothetical protein R3A52_14615 [Polyangiales bacterium]
MTSSTAGRSITFIDGAPASMTPTSGAPASIGAVPGQTASEPSAPSTTRSVKTAPTGSCASPTALGREVPSERCSSDGPKLSPERDQSISSTSAPLR